MKADSENKEDREVGFSPGEYVLWLIVLLIVLCAIFIGWSRVRKTMANAHQSKQIGCCKQILTACALFAQDNGGKYPDGNYNPNRQEPTTPKAPLTAEVCFQALFDAKIMDLEALFYHNKSPKQCGLVPPNEDLILQAGENCWEYIAGMDYSVGNLPLLFEASDSGNGQFWTREGGHPWVGTVVAGMSDGSSTTKASLDKNGRAMTPRTGSDNKSEELVDMFVPTPSKFGWPSTAIIAPATQVNPEWKPDPSKRWIVLLSIGVVGILIVAMARRNMRESKGGSWSDEKEQAAPKS